MDSFQKLIDITFKQSPKEFNFYEAPFTHWLTPVYAGAFYLVFIFLFHQFMKERQEWKLKFPAIMHNLILSVWSLIMFVGILMGLKENWDAGRAIYCVQNENEQTGTLAFWMYNYYISKYYELLDTFFIVAKKRKSLSVLHLWHHFIIGPLSLSWLNGNFTFAWWGALYNTFVHVWMYLYYFLSSAFDYKPYWGRYITQLQISQFFSVFIWIWVYLFVHYILSYPITYEMDGYDIFNIRFIFEKGCAVEPNVIFFSQFVNITFLALFINFYIQHWILKPKKKQKSKKE
mmetsp:Transcript_947/g.1485  ORF Transcript_947/g.1485 Transcript_947/m.1485 type:complete len:288 (-) Transcript_947:36-899(-)